MFSIFTTCRSFYNYNGIFGVFQRNAIQSWLKLKPTPEIIVMGNDPGTKEFCEEFNLIHITVEISQYGTPYYDAMVRKAEELATGNHLLGVSSDIILFQDTITAYEAVIKQFDSFVAICRKSERDQNELIDFNSNWEEEVKKDLTYAWISSGDFFLFSKGFYKNIPPFVIGRSWVDSWLFYEGSASGNMIDLTEAITIVHPRHRHPHFEKGGSEELDTNNKLCDNKIKHIDSANYIMNSDFVINKKRIV